MRQSLGCLFLILAAFVAFPAAAQDCANIQLTVNPNPAIRGSAFAVAVTVTNCSATKLMTKVAVAFVSESGAFNVNFSNMKLDAGETISQSATYVLPLAIAPDTYDATATVTARNRVLDADTTTLIVQ